MKEEKRETGEDRKRRESPAENAAPSGDAPPYPIPTSHPNAPPTADPNPNTQMVSVALMAVSSFLIGCLPTYQMVRAGRAYSRARWNLC